MNKVAIKAFLLSAFILPGLGQLYKGDRSKGGIILILVNIFLLIALFTILRSLGPILLATHRGDVSQMARVLETLRHSSPGARWLLGGFACLWLYAVIDAALAKQPQSSDPLAEH
jgi:hypothetical protein